MRIFFIRTIPGRAHRTREELNTKRREAPSFRTGSGYIGNANKKKLFIKGRDPQEVFIC